MEIMNQLFSQAIGEGQKAAGHGPDDPMTIQPTDERSGEWSPPLPPDTDPAADPLNFTPVGNQVANTPTPIIGTVPFGGVVTEAGELQGGAAGITESVGDNGNGRPGILGIYLMIAGQVEILPDGADAGYLRAGCVLELAGLYLPVRHLTLRVAAGAVCSYAVIGSNLGAQT